MRPNEIIKEICSLPIQKRMYVIKKSIYWIRKQKDTNPMEKAAEALYSDYKNDNRLTAFTVLDCEDFYETRRDLVNKS